MNSIGINKEKRIAIITGVLLFVVTPLLAPKLGEGQNSYVQMLFFPVVLYIYLIYKLYTNLRKLQFRLLDAVISASLLLLLLHIIILRPVNLSIWWWLNLASLSGLYWFTRLQDKETLRALMFVFIIGGMSQCIYGCLQYLQWLPTLNSTFPITGSFINPAPLAGYLSVIFCILVFIFCNITPKTVNIYSTLSISSIFAIFLLLLKSRAALLSFIITTSLILYKKFISKKRIYNRSLYLFLFLCGIIILFIYLYQLREDSANGRLFIWENTWKMIQENAWTGVGIENFKSHFPTYQARFYATHPNFIGKYYDGNTFLAFNEYLKLWAEQGSIVFLLFLSFLCLLWNNRKNVQPKEMAPLYGIVCMLIFGCFSYPSSIFTLQVLFVFLLASLGHCFPLLFSWSRNLTSCIKYIVSILCLLFLYIPIKGIYIVKRWNEVIENPIIYKKDISYYEKHYNYFQDNMLYVLLFYRALKKTDNAPKTLSLLNNAIHRIPVVGLYLLRGDLHMEMKNYMDAEQDFKFASYLSPTLPEPAYKLSLLYVKMNRQEEALILLKTKLAMPEVKKKDIMSKEIYLEMKELLRQLSTLKNHHQ